ncbi:MAG: metal-dependent transcriptional regulator [Planctomycetes bacterium]|nr:metal-dependent transcriptional regulator [Planctomycetota bacterium]
MIDPRIEEVLESLYESEVEQGRPSPLDAAAEPVRLACEAGLTAACGGGLRLTEPGRAAARDVVRRHRLAERLLVDVLDVAREDVEEDACQFEHIIRRGLDEKICRLLGHPRMCPHGKPIPAGLCCQSARADAIREVRPLAEGPIGGEGVVAYLSTRQRRDIQKLMAMGILPGSRIRLIRRFPSYVFQVGYGQFTADESLAAVIYVHWKEDANRERGAGGGGNRES